MNLRFLADLAERTVATYAQAALGLLLADSTGMISISGVKAAAVAALPAALAVVKAALAGSVLSSGTASALPATTDTAAVPETAVAQAAAPTAGA
jgi:hypothetical protein